MKTVNGYERDSPRLLAVEETRGHWKCFMRNGRWGTCVACPRTTERNVHPEFCEYTDRYDHLLTLDALVEQFNWAERRFEQQVNTRAKKGQ